MRARPHHLIDIVTQIGGGGAFKPHPYGHAVHLVAEQVMADPDLTVTFVVGADDICEPCVHLLETAEGPRCDDVLSHLDPPISKQEYNDDLDRRLMEFLGLSEGQALTFRDYLVLIRERFSGIEDICTHPGQDPTSRRNKLNRGLEAFGV